MTNDLYYDGVKTKRAVFEQRSLRIASVLHDHGVGEDDAIAVLMRNDLLYLELINPRGLRG